MDYNWINTSSTDSAKKSNQSLSPSHSDLKHNISSSDLYLEYTNFQMTEEFSFSQENTSFDEFSLNEQYYSLYMNKCGRQTMEDRFTVFSQKDKEFFFAVFDGHGTSQVAEYLSRNLHTYILQNPNFEYDAISTINEAFRKIDEEVLQNSNYIGGSVVLCAIFKNRRLYIVNLGDSRAIMTHKDSKIIQLSREHRPSQQDELQRIESRGGIVIPVRKALRVQGALAVSRSIGDKDFKQYLSNVPEINIYDITGQEKFLIIGSDGLWNETTNEWIGKYVNNRSVEGLTQKIFDELIRKKEFLKDNTTIICVDVEKLCGFHNYKL